MSPRARALIVAPYERGLDHGGSQRTTAIAEELEANGTDVDWWRVLHRRRGRLGKLQELAKLQPGQVGIHATEPEPVGEWDVAIAAHSYLAAQAFSVTARFRWIDFPNLEWMHLLDVARLAGFARSAQLRGEARLLRRFERIAARRAALVTCVTEDDAGWLREVAGAKPLVVPNMLPLGGRRAADEIRRHRSASEKPTLAYIGTLRFPPNLLSLEQWLRTTWPILRHSWPSLRLRVAGEIPRDQRWRLEGIPGVEVLGFVDDLGSVLATASALVLPFSGRAGTSLRVLFAARAGVPLIGTRDALRGFGEGGGLVAQSPGAWVGAVRRVLAGEVTAAVIPAAPPWPDELTADAFTRNPSTG